MQQLISVSIVEDFPDIREGLEEIFKHSDEFLLLSSYENAEDAVKDLPVANPDIVIMDINLPGMNGIECIKKVKLICPKMQFMMFTIYENHEHVLEALSAGASGYLLKNTPSQKIKESVTELYEGGSPMNSHIARKLVATFQQKPGSDTQREFNISNREQEILQLLAKGYLYKEIALQCGISTGTVKQHIHKIYEKLHVQNRTEALNKMFGSP
ncbi:MAG: response regulator transcription factor [Ginsengibacter sp.]